MRSHGRYCAEPRQSSWRRHDADGISPEACAVIGRHGLSRDRILDMVKAYEAKEVDDFNRAPADDFRDAPLGENLVNAACADPPFGAFRSRFHSALESRDYGTSDAIIVKCLRDGSNVDRYGNGIYGGRKRYVERLEGRNAALFRVARDATRLNRFVASLGEMDNYRRGKWLKEADV